MYRPPPGSRARPAYEHPTWRSVLATFVALGVLPFVLWAVAYPFAAAGLLAATAGGVVAVRRVSALVRCFQECRAVAFDLGGTVRITVTHPPSDDAT